MKKIKSLIIVALLLCTFGVVGCSTSVNDINNIVDTSISFGAEVLSCVSIANGTAIKSTDNVNNQLSVAYDNGDVLVYSTTMKAEEPSISFNMTYTSSEKKSVDFVVEIIESLSDKELTDNIKDELTSAIENDSSAEFEFTTKSCTTKVNFKQTGNVFSLCVESIG